MDDFPVHRGFPVWTDSKLATRSTVAWTLVEPLNDTNPHSLRATEHRFRKKYTILCIVESIRVRLWYLIPIDHRQQPMPEFNWSLRRLPNVICRCAECVHCVCLLQLIIIAYVRRSTESECFTNSEENRTRVLKSIHWPQSRFIGKCTPLTRMRRSGRRRRRFRMLNSERWTECVEQIMTWNR